MEWRPLIRNTVNESRYVTKLIGSQVEKHPLIEVPAQQNHQTSMATNLSKKGCGLVQTSWGGIDPLSAVLELQSPEESFTLDPSARTSSYTSPDFVPWNRRISEIINKTSAYENSIGISSGGTLINRILSNDSSLNERTQKRLNYLNELDDPLQFNATIVNRSGLMHQMDLLKRSSIDAWNSEQRLRALKTVIQAAKLLSDTSPASLYSTKFALISTLLDSFGQLVYERIFSKCTSLTDLPNAQLTCVNWFQKLASIRELIPRIYVEIALFRSYSFIVPTNDWATEAKGHLIRLSDMIRGISDPLVASFSAAYLARCVFEFFPEDKTIFHQIYVDFITRLVKMDSVAEKKLHSSAGTSKHGYWEMFYEPLNWISGCLLHKADTESTDKVFTVLQQFLNSTSSKFSLQHIFLVKCFLMNVSLERGLNDSIKWIGLIETCLQQQFQLTVDNELLATFGDLLSHTKTSNFEVPLAQKRALLNQLWPLIGKLSGLNYARTVKSIIPFVVHHFSIKELRILLQEAVQHLSGEKCSLQLQTILFEVFQATLRIEHNVLLRLYQSQAFQQLFDCLQDRSLKSEASQLLLNQFLKHDFRASLDATNKAQNSSEVSTNGHQVFRDSTHVQILMRYCKTVHDCIDCFSLNDERRHVERILLDFTQSIDFHDDPEMQLSFLIECRANFCSFESVVCQTIYSSLRLANHPIVIDRHRSHTCAKGKEFTQAALAFAIVTIPSLANPSDQLRLYLNAAQVALQCACLPQTDLFLKSSIALVSDLLNPKDGHVLTSIPPESFFNSFLSNLMSFMLVVPDHPEHQPLYLLHGIVNILDLIQINLSKQVYATIMLNILRFLSASAQPNYLYHIKSVISNDQLYGGSYDFHNEIVSLGEIVKNRLTELLGTSTISEDLGVQSKIALQSFYTLTICANVLNGWKLIYNCWLLAAKNNVLTKMEITQAIDFVDAKSFDLDESLKELANKMRKQFLKLSL